MRIAGFAMQIEEPPSTVDVSDLEHGICALFAGNRPLRGSVHSELAQALYGTAARNKSAEGRVQLALAKDEAKSSKTTAWPLALRLQGLSTADMPVLSRWLSFDFAAPHTSVPLELGPSWELLDDWRETPQPHETFTQTNFAHRADCCHQHAARREEVEPAGNWRDYSEQCHQALAALDACQDGLRQRVASEHFEVDAYHERIAAERKCLASLAARVADVHSSLAHQNHGQCCACQSEHASAQLQSLARSLAERLDSVHTLLAAQHVLTRDREARDEMAELARCRATLEGHRHWIADQHRRPRQTVTQRCSVVQRTTPLATASRFLQHLTRGEIVAIERNHATGHAEVINHLGMRGGWENLAADQRDLAVLSLCLAAATLYRESGLSLPLLLGEPLARLNATQRQHVVEVLQEFAGRDTQVVVLTCSPQLASQLQARDLSRHTVQAVRTTPAPTPVPQPQRVVVSAPAEPKKPRLEFSSPIESLAFLDAAIVEVLKRRDVRSLSDFFAYDPATLAAQLPGSVSATSVRTWQRAGLLACFVPQLDAYDGYVLAACGIDDVEALAQSDDQALYRRIRSFMRHEPRARHYRSRASRYSHDRLRGWKRSAGSRASDWRNSRYSRRRERPERTPTERTLSTATSDLQLRTQRDDRDQGRTEHENRSRNGSSSQLSTSRSSTAKSNQVARQQEKTSGANTPRFYLQASAPVVDAPTIGPKMAERLARHGIHTVADLLQAEPEQLAKKLKHRQTHAETVLLWQRQARLMCQVPGLRCHDASVLVGCEYFTPASIAAKQPHELLAVVEPFSASKEGQRLLRGGQQPDLAEVTDWITWARSARRSEAA